MYLVDTNVWLEVLLAQERAAEAQIACIRLDSSGLKQALALCQQYQIDFDDAYQYVAAEKHDLIIVSFDKDFDRTTRGRKTPAEIIGPAA